MTISGCPCGSPFVLIDGKCEVCHDAQNLDLLTKEYERTMARLSYLANEIAKATARKDAALGVFGRTNTPSVCECGYRSNIADVLHHIATAPRTGQKHEIRKSVKLCDKCLRQPCTCKPVGKSAPKPAPFVNFANLES